MFPDFEQGLRAAVISSTSYTSDVGGYTLASGGARMRSRIVLAVTAALGLKSETILPVAYAVELLHTAGLLHDNLAEDPEISRFHPTANQVYGDKPALLVGDFISSRSLELAGSLGSIPVLHQMTRAIMTMAEGELKDHELRGQFHTDIGTYLEIITMKTATLFEYCSRAPGLLTRISEAQSEALATYGRSVGIAYQIREDIINLTPQTDEDDHSYRDIVLGRTTLPLIYLLEKHPALRAELIRSADPAKRQALIRAHLTPEIFLACRNQARSFLDQALTALRKTALFTPELEAIPSMIQASIDDRLSS